MLGREFTVETLGFGDTTGDLDPNRAEPRPRPSTDYRRRAVGRRGPVPRPRLAGVVVISDGADTGGWRRLPGGAPPVYAVPVGSPQPLRDREVGGVADRRCSAAGIARRL